MAVMLKSKSSGEQEQQSVKVNNGFLNGDGAGIKGIAGKHNIKGHHYHQDGTPGCSLTNEFSDPVY